jgi:hypothetical protein
VILDDFWPYILPNAKGCPAIIANQATRLAIIELCSKSLIWREYQDSINTVALQTAYAYAPAANQQVVTLLSMTLAGDDVTVVDPQKGRTLDSKGYAGIYAYGTFTGFELRPAQAAAQSIVTYSALAPSIAATTVPDSMGRYIEAIANGALSRILTAKDKEYSDPAGAVNARTRWDDAIADAKGDALRGNARTVTRTSMVRF